MSKDGNAIIGQINKFLRFPENVEISGKMRIVTAVGKRAAEQLKQMCFN